MGKYHNMLFGSQEPETPQQQAPQQAGKYNAMLFDDMREPAAAPTALAPEGNTLTENLMTGAGKGLAGIPSMPRTVADVVKTGEQAVAKEFPGFQIPAATPIGMAVAVSKLWPTFEETHGLLTKMGWENKEANTTADKYEQSIGEFMAGNPTAKARTAVGNIASSLLSESAGQISEGSKYEWLARVFGALAGGAATEGASALRSTTGEVLQDRLQGVTKGEFEAGKVLQQQSREAGVPLMGAEALDSAPLQRLSSDVAASPYGQPIIEQALKNRPQEVTQAVGTLKGKIAPETIPSEMAARASNAATESIRGAEKARTEAVRPLYKQAGAVQVPIEEIDPIIASISNQSSRTTNPALLGELDSLKSQIVKADGNLDMLSSIRRDFRDRIETPAFGATTLSKEASSKITPILTQIEETLSKSSPDYKEANALYAEITRQVVDPLKASGVGKIAGGGFDPKDTQNINNAISVLTDYKSVRPKDIRQVATELGKIDTTVFPSMVRVVLDNAFDKASKKLLSGENRNMGALFTKEIYGTPQQAKNLRAMIEQSAIANNGNPKLAWHGFENMLKILERTGRIPGSGSQTAPRQQLSAELARSKTAAAGDIISTSPLSSINKGIRQWQERGRYKELATILSDPNSVEKIEQLARMAPNSRKARFVASQLLGISRETGKLEE